MATFTSVPFIPVPVSVYNSMMANDGGIIRFVLDENWKSTVKMMDGITVDLGGTIELTLADNLNYEDFVGTSFRLFNWNGRLQQGDVFNHIIYVAGTQWDLSELYTNGTVTLIPEPSILSLTLLGGFLLSRRRK
jgi:hypothetical protein